MVREPTSAIQFEQILKKAHLLEEKGHLEALKEGIKYANKSIYKDNNWFAYWDAVILRQSNGPDAITKLETIFKQFQLEQDIKGQYKTWLIIVETLALAFDDLKPLKYWIKEYDLLRARHPRCPGLELKLKVFALAAGVMSLVQPNHPKLKKLIHLCQIGGPLIPFKEPRAAILAYLSFHYLSSGQIAHLNALSKHLIPSLHDSSLAIQIRLLSYAMIGLHEIMIGNENAKNTLDEGLTISAPGEAFYSTVHAYRIYYDAMQLDFNGAKDKLNNFLENIPSNQRMDLSHHDFMMAWVSALEGNYSVAIEQSKLAKTLSKTLGFDFGVALNSHLIVQLAVFKKDYRQAQLELDELLTLAEFNNSQLMSILHQFCQSWLILNRDGIDSALPFIERSFQTAENEGILTFPGFLHSVMAELALVLIGQNKNNLFISQMIKRWSLIPFSSIQNQVNWPWKLRIRTLGELTIETEGKTVEKNIKSQRRSIELIQTLVGLGEGHVSKSKLSYILWPDSDGDKANHALENLLYRTRKLLGPDILLIDAGEIELNKEHCWVDLWALKNLDVDHIENHQHCLKLSQQLNDIYRGSFLPSNESSYALIMREKQRHLYINKAVKLGQKLTSYQYKEEVIEFWQQAIEREPLHEYFYYQLSLFHSDTGSYSEAKQVYQRCKKLMLSTYNSPTSKEFNDFAEREYL